MTQPVGNSMRANVSQQAQGRGIDFADVSNLRRAKELATASSPAQAFGKYKASDIVEIHQKAEELWGLWIGETGQTGTKENVIVAITGNGPTSEANAQFFVDARTMVLGLIDEVEHLRARCESLEALIPSPNDGKAG